MSHVKTFDPSILLGDRLGLTLYGAFVEAHLAGDARREAEMYTRFISSFPGEAGVHTPQRFAALIDRVRAEGFDPYFPVYANPQEYSLLEGSHRCAIAMQLGMHEIPYHLRFDDSRTDDAIFPKVFDPDEMRFLYEKRAEYIERCDELTALKCRLRVHMRDNVDSYQAAFSSRTQVPALRFYQGLERLGLLGKRPSQLRFEAYGIGPHLRADHRVLELGCNVGFFALTTAAHVAQVQGFEIDPNYVAVAREVARHLGATNASFEASSVETFQAPEPYDVVVSTAVHGWCSLPFGDFVARLDSWTRPGGLILFESHEIDAEKDWREKKAFLLQRHALIGQGFIDDVDTSLYQSEMREYLLLRKPG